MAKGLRSSTEKANRSQLRSRIFGPVESARRERLSAKLTQSASKYKIREEAGVKVAQDHEGTLWTIIALFTIYMLIVWL